MTDQVTDMETSPLAQVPLPDLLAFLDATAALLRPTASVPKWMKARVLNGGQAICWHCKEPATRVGYIIPPPLGGDTSAVNVIPVCAPCGVAMREVDPLAKPWETGAMLKVSKATQRREALAASLVHAVPRKHARSAATVRAHLADVMWDALPRVPVCVWERDGDVLVTPIQSTPGMPWAVMAMTLKRAGAVHVAGAPGVLQVPGRAWEGLAWELIARHALLRRVARSADGRLVPKGDDWATVGASRATWRALFDGVAACRRGSVTAVPASARDRFAPYV